MTDMKRKLLLGILSLCASLSAEAEEWPVLRTYEGEFLRRVKMPIGGLGTGTISLAGRGALVDWEIRSHPDKGFTPTAWDAASAFWVRTEDVDGQVVLRLLEGPLDTELYEGGDGGRAPNHGFPRFRRNAFKVAYPLAQVELSDDDVPVAATLEAMNPLATGDPEASGIPAALLRWKIENRTARPLKVSVLGLLVNPSAEKGAKRTVSDGVVRGVSVGADDVKPVNDELGRVSLVVPADAGDVSTAVKIGDLGWRVRLDRFWKQFAAIGRAADLADPDAKTDLDVAALSVAFDLPANAVRRVPFALGWRFPHRRAWSGRYKDSAHGPFDAALDVGNHYAAAYPDEIAPAAKLLAGLDGYEGRSVAFVRDVLAKRVPEVVKEAALFNLSTLRCETCFRTADGHFFGWEGIFDKAGSCYGSCTHVWGYEHALIDLWPSLAKDMTELQYGPQMDERGHISFRVGLPLATKARSTIACADGQMQCAIKAYENWKKSGDDAWLKRLYPRIRMSIEFCWIPGGWDADGDGVMEGCQHNTMDVEYYGPNPQMEFLYLAALKAVAAMADACADAGFAEKCRRLARQGSVWTEKNLFNGYYYEHKVQSPTGPIAEGITAGNASNLADPDFQLAAGCLVDQMLGDYAARHVGLGAVADEAQSGRALHTILAKNASANVGAVYNCGRDYAFPEEPALKMAWYPSGRMPHKPFPYYGENMTGFEYVVAANLVQRGRLAEAERIVRDIRSRYDGRKRNPFDEAECGHHYARALAAWSVLVDWKPK